MHLRWITVASTAAMTLACSAMVIRARAAGPIPLEEAAMKNNASAVFVVRKQGSYILKSNVIIKHANQDAVDITASNVTLDMQGFSIVGTNTPGTGIGINVVSGASNVTITNGTVAQMSGGGVVVGANSVVSSVKAMQNVGTGIQAGPSSELTNNVAVGNAGSGLICANNCLVTGNVATSNTTDIALGSGSGYGNNVIKQSSVSGGVSFGNNVCNGAQC